MALAPWALRGLFAIALLYLLRDARALLAPIVIAVVLTFLLAPLVRALRRRGLGEVFGAALVVAALLGTVVPLATTLAEPASQWWERAPQMITQVFARFDKLRAQVPGLAPAPAAASASAVPPRSARERAAAASAASAVPPADPVKERIATESVAFTGVLLGHGASFALSMVATVMLLYFLLASEHWMLSRIVETLPRRRARALLLGGIRAAQREIGRFLLSLGIINIAVGLITGLLVWRLGLPNPTLWAVLVAVLNFVPYIGPLMIVGLLGLAATFTFDASSAILAPPLGFLAVHAVESNVVSPWFVGRRLALSPVSLFLSVMFWGWLWGMAGALLAVPILIGVRAACRRITRLRGFARFLDGDARDVPTLPALLRARRARGTSRGVAGRR